MDVPVYDKTGAELRRAALPDTVFGIEPNHDVMHQALVRQQANARQGTHATQTRSQVDRTGAKWYRQKGTGRARHGARTANIFVGGAVSHGPQPRSYAKKMPRRMRRLALRSALSAKAADEAIVLVDALDFEAPRTRAVADLVDQVCDGRSTLVLLAGRNAPAEKSIRNLEHVRYLHAAYLNVRDLLGHERVLIELDALDAVVTHLDAEAAAADSGTAGDDSEPTATDEVEAVDDGDADEDAAADEATDTDEGDAGASDTDDTDEATEEGDDASD